jgi:sugar fermentation stimulation protein A
VSALVPHRWRGEPIHATLIERPNRFLAICRVGRRTLEAHVPDRGRCLDLLVPGQPLVLVEVAPASGLPPRRTRYTALLARALTAPSPWVCLDPAGAPRLVERALASGLLPSLDGYRVSAREIAIAGVRKRPRPRIDLRLAGPPGELLCEVKSVGAAREGIALFPDAPTERGVRHLALLSRLARRPDAPGTAVVFCAQRGDVTAVRADAAIDEPFARALERARRAGVRVAALACEATPRGMRLRGEIPVL